MKKYLLHLLAAFIMISVNPFQLLAQQANVKIECEVTTPMTLNEGDLQKLKRTEIVEKDHEGNDHPIPG